MNGLGLTAAMALALALVPAVAAGAADRAAASLAQPAEQDRARPQDDFYLATNAAWLASTDIPAEVPWISPYVVNALAIQGQIEAIVTAIAAEPQLAGSDAARIADLYRSYLDTAAIDAAGLAPLADLLARIDGARTPEAVFALFPELMIEHADPDPDAGLPQVTPFALVVRADDRDATRRVPRLAPAGLGLPARDYYLSDEPRLAETRRAYAAHVAATLRAAGQPDPVAAAGRVLALESRLARALAPEETLRDPAATYHPFTLAQLGEACPGFDWPGFLVQAGIGATASVIVEQPDYLAALCTALRTAPADDWQAYLRWQVLRRFAQLLPEPFRAGDFAFYGRVLSGSTAERPRPARAMLFVQGAMAEPLGRLWTERHVDPRTKPAVQALAEAMRQTFAERLARSDWLSPPTRAAAQDKLAQMLIKVGYPDTWEDFADLATDAADPIGNARALARLGQSPDRQAWLDVPQATSAYYNRSTNELALPAGLLQPPWFDPGGDLAANLGALGAVIGHEMGHAFDDQGAHFDGTGTVRDWWTPEDRRRFEQRTARLVAQYDRFASLPGLQVHGRLTLSENIGDLTGLALAHATLVRLRGPALTRAEERRFFAAFCVRWRAKYREPLQRPAHELRALLPRLWHRTRRRHVPARGGADHGLVSEARPLRGD